MTRRAHSLPALLALAAGCTTTPTAPAPDADPEEPPQVAVEAEAVAEAVVEVPAAPAKSEQRITIAAVGDMMLGTDYPTNRLPDDDGASLLAAVTPWLAAADLSFGNLEGVLLAGGEPGKKCSNPAACYRFRSPPRYAQHFVNAGFDVLSLANNHARDFGEAGRTATMRTLAEYGIAHSGRVGDFATLEVRGLRVAVLAYAVTRNSNMLLDYDYAEEIIGAYARSHDVVIVSFHGGAEGEGYTRLPFDEEEYYGEPRGDVVRFARMAVDAGADLVIGHGPHVVRAMERYEGRLIAYSLGNFATYYGISVNGIKGIAPILLVTLDGDGRFVDGEIVSTRQLRPDGPSIDPSGRALELLRSLSIADFVEPGLVFADGGRLLPAERPPVARRSFDEATDGGPLPCTEPWFWLIEAELGIGLEADTPDWLAAAEARLATGLEPGSDNWCTAVHAQLR